MIDSSGAQMKKHLYLIFRSISLHSSVSPLAIPADGRSSALGRRSASRRTMDLQPLDKYSSARMHRSRILYHDYYAPTYIFSCFTIMSTYFLTYLFYINPSHGTWHHGTGSPRFWRQFPVNRLPVTLHFAESCDRRL